METQSEGAGSTTAVPSGFELLHQDVAGYLDDDQIDQIETSDEIDDLIGGALGNIIHTQGEPIVTEG